MPTSRTWDCSWRPGGTTPRRRGRRRGGASASACSSSIGSGEACRPGSEPGTVGRRRTLMKIARVEALHADGGWRPWTFVRVETDDGLVGWGECSDNRSPYGLAGSVRDLADLLVGQDPRPVERLYWDMLRRMRQNSSGVSHKAMAGIELALWDIKAKALGVPGDELFGGPLRDGERVYGPHCRPTRARKGAFLGT